MNINVIILICILQQPIIMLGMGILLWRFPPNYNDYIGYKTSMSQKSSAAWSYAQIFFGRLCTLSHVFCLIITVIVGVISIVINFEESAAAVVALSVAGAHMAVLFADIIATEIALKRHFDKLGNPKA